MKNFSEIYQKLYKENHEELEALRQESKKKHIIALTCIVLLAIIISLTINTVISEISVKINKIVEDIIFFMNLTSQYL